MDVHFRLNEKTPLPAALFNIWKFLFIETIEEHFEGEVAEMAKQKIITIADLMVFKIHNSYNSPSVAKDHLNAFRKPRTLSGFNANNFF